jgi:hypothetical protein
MKKIFIVTIILAFEAVLSGISESQVMLRKAVISNGGGVGTNGTTNGMFIAGQTAAGTASNGQITGHFGVLTNATAVNAVTEGAGAINSLKISPNPASNDVSINISLAASGNIDLLLYDASGHMISTLFTGNKDAGTFTQRLDTKTLASGAYFIAARIPGALVQAKLNVIK